MVRAVHGGMVCSQNLGGPQRQGRDYLETLLRVHSDFGKLHAHIMYTGSDKCKVL